MATDPLHKRISSLVPAARSSEAIASEDEQLVERVKIQDERAIAELYERYSTLVFSVALHILRDESAAEDVTQEVFLKLWKAPDAFDGQRGSVRTWLTVVARHRAIDRCRARRTEISVADLIIPIDCKQLRDVHIQEAIGRIASLISEMPTHLRSTLQLAYLEGLSHSEISSLTGDALGTVKSRIRLGLDWIRKRLNCRQT